MILERFCLSRPHTGNASALPMPCPAQFARVSFQYSVNHYGTRTIRATEVDTTPRVPQPSGEAEQDRQDRSGEPRAPRAHEGGGVARPLLRRGAARALRLGGTELVVEAPAWSET